MSEPTLRDGPSEQGSGASPDPRPNGPGVPPTHVTADPPSRSDEGTAAHGELPLERTHSLERTLGLTQEQLRALGLSRDRTEGARPAETELARSFGNYSLIRKLASGGMGVVYLARQERLGRDVALKMILSGDHASTGEIQRFQLEAEAAAKLDHPGIVPIFEVGEQDGQHYSSMGYVEGGSLASSAERGFRSRRRPAGLCHAG
jgi:Protein kinase domain